VVSYIKYINWNSQHYYVYSVYATKNFVKWDLSIDRKQRKLLLCVYKEFKPEDDPRESKHAALLNAKTYNISSETRSSVSGQSGPMNVMSSQGLVLGRINPWK
jgi:hypothetical protein